MMVKPPVWPDDGVILYDGICVLCSHWVRFVAKRDVARRFRFTPIESPYGLLLAETLGIDPEDPDTNAVILDARALRRSDAALAVVSALPYWGWVAVLRLIPRALRDGIYTFIARNRYRLVGDALFATWATCRSPTGSLWKHLLVFPSPNILRDRR
jgi:predicted DCC family thiol-disulfide oxidoreductase YuxK